MVNRMSKVINVQASVVGDHCIDREGPSTEEIDAIRNEMEKRRRDALVAHAEERAERIFRDEYSNCKLPS
jgi:hypothetical protein